MKRNLIILLTGLLLSCSVVGCGSETVVVNVNNTEDIHNTTFGTESLVRIGHGLYYDAETKIVYWWNMYNCMSSKYSTPSPYYAPNGLPYKYNPETNTLEEIEND